MNVVKSVVSISATTASVCMVASPILTVTGMRKDHSIGVMTITFFCAQYANCNVWAMYGIQNSAIPVILCNVFGSVVATYCVLSFLTVARVEERSGNALKATTYRTCLQTTIITAGFLLAVLSLVLCLCNFVNFTTAARVNGLIGGCCSVFMLSSPLGMAVDIIASKNAEGLQPVTLSFATLNSILWFLYGLLNTDLNIAIPNALCTGACLFQFFLLLRYGRRPTTQVTVSENIPAVPVDSV